MTIINNIDPIQFPKCCDTISRTKREDGKTLHNYTIPPPPQKRRKKHIIAMSRWMMLQAQVFEAFNLSSDIIISFTAIMSIFNKDDEDIMFKDIRAKTFTSR